MIWKCLIVGVTQCSKQKTLLKDGMEQFLNKGDEPLKQDVYIYKLRYKDIDGKINNKTDHVTLMKKSSKYLDKNPCL